MKSGNEFGATNKRVFGEWVCHRINYLDQFEQALCVPGGARPRAGRAMRGPARLLHWLGLPIYLIVGLLAGLAIGFDAWLTISLRAAK